MRAAASSGVKSSRACAASNQDAPSSAPTRELRCERITASDLEPARALAERLEPRAEHVRDADPNVRNRRPLGRDEITIAAHAPAGAADERERQWIRVVRLAVAHAGAERNQRIVEYGALAFGRGAQPLEERREQCR